MLKQIKRTVAKTSFGKLLKKILGKKSAQDTFEGSKEYWENRYGESGNSGSGSYANLARYKADFLNKFVDEHEIDSVIEFGCGDGHQLSLANYPLYYGFDVSQKALDICTTMFEADMSKYFLLVNEENLKNRKADLTMSLDVIYHLIENNVYEEYMSSLFDSSERFVIVYSSNYDERIAPHVLSRKFTTWVEENKKGWKMMTHEKNPYPYDPSYPDHTSIADFYIYKKV
jgi:SAM-dependent methyltransferase